METPEKAAGEALARAYGRAARTHDRALLVELWAAEYYERRGEAQAAARHHTTVGREAAFAEVCYSRLSQRLETV